MSNTLHSHFEKYSQMKLYSKLKKIINLWFYSKRFIHWNLLHIYIYKFYINNIINFILIILILIKSEFPDEFFFNVKILLLLILY